eukprot:TRINITY_DN5037_c0_g1_i1.p1 TRINITY_DN5037_c0_g1~~TRINITY_DN5037_c0_g1_i1.p1  ORF type:complete len:450 (-),score=70.62 TRINITY_DN5037_c0_g1_i1:1556-2905(-)
MASPAPLFLDILSETPTEIESVCMNCYSKGTTRLFLTKIPFFKEIIFMSFSCPDCGYRSNDVQSQAVQEQGIKYTLKITSQKDLNRSIVKAEGCTISLPELEFEIPPTTQKGTINTLEGTLKQACQSLREAQPLRRVEHPELAEKIEQFAEKLEGYANGNHLPFTIIVDDPSGNSFVENPSAPARDPNIEIVQYFRSLDQNHALGFYPDYNPHAEEQEQPKETEKSRNNDNNLLLEEAVTLPELCQACGREGEVRMCQTNVPHFKDVIIMAFDCADCGYKTNEVKAGGSIEKLGRRISILVDSAEDLNRDLLKSETALVEIPELGLELQSGTLGGRFTTIEGFMELIHEHLGNNPFLVGDSSDVEGRARFQKFLADLREMGKGTRPFTFIVDDPAGKSHIQNLFYPDEDPKLQITEYERTEEQNDDLGISDMITENYEENLKEEEASKE